MINISEEPIIKQTLINSIDREELLLKKYEEYYKTIQDKELKALLKEFKETSREHIDLIKAKLQKLGV